MDGSPGAAIFLGAGIISYQLDAETGMIDQLGDGDEVEKLVITIKNKQPVELIDLAQSMLALAGEYRQVLLDSEGAG